MKTVVRQLKNSACVLRASEARGFFLCLCAFYFFVPFFSSAGWCQQVETDLPVKQLDVQASAGWVETGLEVKEGEKYEFLASGSISCQLGNPIAACGPEGLDLQTVQQPLTEHNLGALIGKVVKVISVRKDEETGEEIREEVSKVFYIGTHSQVEMPLEGKLYLGVNDNVNGDNGGYFSVSIFKRQAGQLASELESAQNNNNCNY
ncbi:MAG: hypothetical protein PHU81_05940 [Acidobacteriota bacterium]|nr:hypothetical protein [Acidobacteriota bacterium]